MINHVFRRGMELQISDSVKMEISVKIFLLLLSLRYAKSGI